MDIKVSLNTNTFRGSVIVNANTTVKEVLEENEIDYSTTTVHMDGCPLNVSELNSTFADLGVTDRTIVSCIQKAQNA